VYAWRADKIVAAVFTGVVWLVLVGLMLVAEFGFFSKSQDNLESQKNVAGLPYQAAKARLDSANERLASMSNNASVDVSGLSAKRDALVAKKTTLSKELSQCPKNHFRACINPKKAEIDAISTEIAGLDSQLGSGQGYKGALTERDAALKDLQANAKAGGTSESHMSPVFIYGERLTGIPAKQLQVNLMIVLAFVMELWGSFSAALLMSDILDSRESDVVTTASNPVAAAPIQQVAQPAKAVFAPQPAMSYNAVNYGYSMIPPTPTQQPTKKA
jgi:outer membrane murein-binding lipoprotein Lpp